MLSCTTKVEGFVLPASSKTSSKNHRIQLQTINNLHLAQSQAMLKSEYHGFKTRSRTQAPWNKFQHRRPRLSHKQTYMNTTTLIAPVITESKCNVYGIDPRTLSCFRIQPATSYSLCACTAFSSSSGLVSSYDRAKHHSCPWYRSPMVSGHKQDITNYLEKLQETVNVNNWDAPWLENGWAERVAGRCLKGWYNILQFRSTDCRHNQS